MKNNGEIYNRFYANAVEHAYGKPNKIVELIPDYITSGSVLDLGAGDGRHALFLAQKGFSVTAVDTSGAALEKMKRFADEKGLSVEAVVGDIAQWPIDKEYDAIIATTIFQHLITEDALRVLGEMKKQTCGGGVNAISLFTNNGDRYLLDREEDPYAFYPDDNWLREFYGDWEIISYEESSGPLIGKVKKDGSPMTSVVARILARKPL